VEKPLGQVELKGFALVFSTARYNMDVNVKLRYVIPLILAPQLLTQAIVLCP